MPMPMTFAERYCKLCGLGRREWMECEMPDCDIETQEEADARKRAYAALLLKGNDALLSKHGERT